MSQNMESELSALTSAEDFLNYFQVDYNPTLVQTKRIQLLRLFHSVLEALNKAPERQDYKRALKIAYKQLENGNELAFPERSCEGCTECDD
ncbi:nitrogenase-stabilizing/protective protein NifW [Vibrio hannami]|uniref:nitrogenase-stabilizing/protective protein NifW n=1 Tax=Vibrio hannami TaxID=2717094 RepID=UPI00240ED77A|nr:nitrogenase-stabilizing/protective protein NifW [Vibrio hannami]MDG3085018.1 nitrogenase-stabilizing/protective protein NifW [Vibrio hannami]